MEFEDDYDSLIPEEKSPSPNRGSKLKRLKKGTGSKKSETLQDFTDADDEPLSGENESDSIDSLLREEGGECRMAVKRMLEFNDLGQDSALGFDDELEEKKKVKKGLMDFSEVDELLLGSLASSGFGGCSEEGGNKDDSIDSLLADEKKGREMTSESGFDSRGEEFDEIRDEILSDDGGGGVYSELGLVDGKKRRNVEEFNDELEEDALKKTKKRAKDADVIAKISKRKEKKEMNDHFVEYQRSMRERRDVSFKPVPLARKPISMLLEKIRMRKQEVSNSKRQNDRLRELTADDTSDDIPSVEIQDKKCQDSGLRDLMAQPHPEEVNLVDSPVDPSAQMLHANHPRSYSQLLSSEKPRDAFRAPVSDTQDLFNDSPIEETQDEKSSEESGEAMEEDLTPSLLAVDLKLDSALPDEDRSSSDEEGLDKENTDLLKSHPSGDPVREFLDEEAEEENDSDDDPMRFEDEEDDDDVDAHELDDINAGDYNEPLGDHEKRNELHQMWLQQQDELGTVKLMQKLRHSSIQKEALLSEEDENGEKKTDSPIDESEDEDPIPTVKRMSSKLLQKLIPQMYTDNDDEYVSSDDEETEKMLHKQRLIENLDQEHEAKDSFVSLSECETSREVFGRIKKLNVLPDAKKKANTCKAFFDTLLTKGGCGDSVKHSFRSRASKNSVSSINKHRSSSARSYIFERDDSSSRSSAAESVETSDNHEHKSKRNFPAKFTSSQGTLSSQRTQIASSQTTARSSLFEILRGSSIKTRCCTSDDTISCDAAFKSVRASVKLQGRS
ncbi:hypothetical protein Droror1_Dr00000844 [Drosera rotundifolia]